MRRWRQSAEKKELQMCKHFLVDSKIENWRKSLHFCYGHPKPENPLEKLGYCF